MLSGHNGKCGQGKESSSLNMNIAAISFSSFFPFPRISALSLGPECILCKSLM